MAKQIIATIYEQYSKGKFNDVLGLFEEQEPADVADDAEE